MAHPLNRRRPGAAIERMSVITGGGPGMPRVLMHGTAAWVEPEGGHTGYGSGLVPACLRVSRVRVRPATTAEAIDAAIDDILAYRHASARPNIGASIVMDVTSDAAATGALYEASRRVSGLHVRPLALVAGPRDPVMSRQTSLSGADMVGADWLVSRVRQLLPRVPAGVQRGWPYVRDAIVVDLSTLAAPEDDPTTLGAAMIEQQLRSAEALIRRDLADDAPLLATSPTESLAAALALGVMHLDTSTPAGAWGALPSARRLHG